MTFPDLLGHTGYLCLMVGILLVARRNIWGWPLRALGEAIWIYVGVLTGLTSPVIWGFLFVAMEAYGFWNWRKTANKTLAT